MHARWINCVLTNMRVMKVTNAITALKSLDSALASELEKSAALSLSFRLISIYEHNSLGYQGNPQLFTTSTFARVSALSRRYMAM